MMCQAVSKTAQVADFSLHHPGSKMIEELSIAEAAAKQAGEAIRSSLGIAAVGEKGTSYNLVTEADFAAERTIFALIRKHFPGDAILGEESASSVSLESPRLWIVDPLDGTTNFAHGIPHFSVSIAFAVAGNVVCGAIYDPMRGELFAAERGKGATCNGKSISVSLSPDLTRAVIATGFYYDRGTIMLRTLDSMRKLLTANIQGIRRLGSAALDLCYVACGRFDCYFEYRLSPWDFAAGMLIVSEAGGECTDIDGAQRGLRSKGMICSNGCLHREFSDTVRLSLEMN